MTSESLCIGDKICMYSEEPYGTGYVYSIQSSKIHSEVAIKNVDRLKPNIPDPQAISFTICVANRYKLNKKYRKIKEKSETHPEDLLLKTQVSQSEIGAEAENEDNVAEQQRQLGKKVLYGQTVQLRHVFTSKYLKVSTTQTSVTESSNMQVDLCPYNSKHAQFRIMPRYKVKAEGDIVQVEDQIIFESVKSPGQYLHISNSFLGSQSVYDRCHEVNLSVRQSGFTIYRIYKPERAHTTMLKAGVPIRLFHKEIEAYLCAEGLFDDAIAEDVHLRVRIVDQNFPKTLSPSSSANTYWQVEMQDGAINGGIVRWEQQVRFRHMVTRMYLKVDTDKSIGLTDNNNDPKTVFRLHPVIKENDQIEFETYCRIEHVVTDTWIHALDSEYSKKQFEKTVKDEKSMAGLLWSTAVLKQVGVNKEMQYDDAFTLQQVEPELVEIFNFMAGMVPFIQKLIKDKKEKQIRLTPKETSDIIQAFDEMKSYMIVNNIPNKQRQKLLRNLKIVDLIVKMLQISYIGTPDKRQMIRILVECYDVLYTYLKGDSRKNELYIAKHIDFFEAQISHEGDIGLNAAHMVMELVKDNRKIVDRITKNHIDLFIDLLKKNKNYRYLDLLSVLCVCDGVAIPDNQAYITDMWLKGEEKSCVFHTEMGQAINKEKNIVYVSIDKHKRVWTPLHDFVEQGRVHEAHVVTSSQNKNSKDPRATPVQADAHFKHLETDQDFLFLHHQLDLFEKLCYGRNVHAISVITDELKYLTWEEAFVCLSNEQLPDQLRAKYCSLIICLFVDVGENSSVLDRVNLTFVYDDIGHTGPKVADAGDVAAREKSLTKKYFPTLRDWISQFLFENKDMTASLIGHNMLIQQVLRLVQYLVAFGYYGDMEDIKALLGPLLSLLDGRNDKPHPNISGAIGLMEVQKKYTKEARYKQSKETKAIVDAKYQAMVVLDLFFNFRFNLRLERFVDEFKQIHSSAHHRAGGNPELGEFLNENYDIYENPSLNSSSVKKLKDIFSESAFFKGFPLTDILLDLSHYDYDKMNVQSMMLLNRYYSAFDNLFKRAVQAQVLITERSVEVLTELRSILPTMQRMVSSKMTQEQTKVMSDIIDRMIQFCSLPDEPEEHHPMNQSILYNHSILATLFDILSQELDIRLIEQYSGIRTIFRKCFLLMKAMARGNPVVQQRLFDRLDMMLDIVGAEPELALALIEVFTGNKHTCLKVLPHQVHKITMLIAKHTSKAPQFLDLLNALVKVEELNLPLKRNQGYVMKYFMQYRQEIAFTLDTDREARKKALASKGDSPEMAYRISLVDMLATCAEGENRFIESICQTIFSIDELLEIVTDENIDNNLKRPYLRFLLWVYLNTAGGMVDSGASDIPHDSRVWSYMKTITNMVESLVQFIENNTTAAKTFLKKPPTKSNSKEFNVPLDDPEVLNEYLSSAHGGADYQTHHGSLHYMFEAVLPFLQVFFRQYYTPDSENHPQEADVLDNLAKVLVSFSDVVGPMMCNAIHMKTMVSSLNVILSASTLPVKVMEEFQEKYGGQLSLQDVRSDGRKKYDEEYQVEEELNNQLNVFAINYAAAYGGFNDVKTQIGYNNDSEYTNLEGDEVLPLGQEFQEHIKLFLDEDAKTPVNRYKLAQKLVQQLAISASNKSMSEKQRLQQELLDIKCLQLLRGMIHNEIVLLPDDWENNVRANKHALRRIEQVQNALNDHSAMLNVLGHLGRTGDDIVREVLAFLAAILFAGNENVQSQLIDYFLGTREEMFFFAVKNRMQLSAMATKEKRSLMTQHQAKVDEAIEQAKALRKAMKTGQMAAQEIMAANKMGSMLMASQSQVRSKLSLGGGPKNRKRSQALKNRYGSQSYLGSNASMKRAKMLEGSQILGLAPPGGGPGGGLAPLLGSAMLSGSVMEMKAMKRTEDKQPLLGKSNKVAPEETPEIVIQELNDEDIAQLAEMALEDQKDFADYKDEGYIELVLKILGLMCDGQNRTLQDYLREQPDNIKSVNLVSETARFLGLLYSSINRNTIGLVTELFQTLVEFASGNQQNQAVIFDNKICDYINYILRGGQFHGCKEADIMKIKKTVAALIMALIEEDVQKPTEYNPKPSGVANDVVESLDEDSIFQVAYDCYKLQINAKEARNQYNPAPADRVEAITTVGFSYFNILLRMIDLSEDNHIKKNRLVKTQEEEDCWVYYMNNVMSIEILKDDQVQKIYFRVKDKTVLREDVKEKFKYAVDRSSPSNKLREFMDWSKDIMMDIKYTRKVYSYFISRFFTKYWLHFNMLMLFVSFLFFLLIMITWKAPDNIGEDYLGFIASTNTSAKPDYRYDETIMQYVTFGLGGLHNLLTLCVLISFFITNHPSLPSISNIKSVFKKVDFRADEDEEDEDDEDDNRGSNLEVEFFSFITFWYILLFIMSILGTIFWGYFFSFHLLHMAYFNQLVMRAIQAVTKNGSSLLWVFLYGLIFIVLYALISFAYFRDVYSHHVGQYCSTVYECFVTVLHQGLIVGTYEFLETPEGRPFTWHIYKAIFDLSFFIFITTIGLNIIFGIIVDTFSELRDDKWQVDNDMRTTCFICSRSSYDFEHQSGGFENHVKQEHNQWSYLFFFIHLDETRPNDYTAVELYVSRNLASQNYDFFPLNRALSLQQDEDNNEIRFEKLMKQVNYLVEKMKDDEAAKERDMERKQQQEWERQFRSKPTKQLAQTSQSSMQ